MKPESKVDTSYVPGASKGSPTPPRETRISNLLQRTVDGALIGIIFVAPYFLGGRHPIGRFVYVTLAVLMTTAWLARQCVLQRGRWRRSSAQWLVLAGAMLVTLQLVSLPQSVLGWILPNHTNALPLWTPADDSPVRLGVWSQISLVPEATRGGLVLFVTYALLLLIVLQRLRGMADVERTLRWIGLSAAIMASFALVQHFVSNGKFLWVYEHPFRNSYDPVKGSFINRNHFTHMLALGIGPLIFWIVSVRRPASNKFARRHEDLNGAPARNADGAFALIIALSMVVFAGLMSLSRGGAIAMAVAVAVCGVFCYRLSVLRLKYLAAGLGIATLIAVALSIHGYDRVAGRLDDLTSGSLDELDRKRGRRDVWAANCAAIGDYPLLGTGVGSHAEVHPMYRHDSPSVEFTHAENGYLQVASETGMVGLLLLLLGIGLCASWCWRTWSRARSSPPSDGRSIVALGAVLAGLTASVVHSFVDFVWYIPACMSLTVILIACALRLWMLTNEKDSHATSEITFSRPIWMTVTGVFVLVSAWMIHDRLGPAVASFHWDNYLRASVASSQMQRRHMQKIRSGGEDYPLDQEADPEVEALNRSMVTHLQQVIRNYPDHARAHLRLAGLYLERFDWSQRSSSNAMDLSQIRDAAIASQFASRSDLDSWLHRAFGDSVALLDQALWHARRGLAICPLQGEGYLYLAELCFLEGSKDVAKGAYVDQAQLVRPNDEKVLFIAGKEACLAGDLDTAMDYWKRCFHLRGAYQWELIRLVAARAPVEFFWTSFQPQLRDLQLLHSYYKRTGQANQLRELCDYYLQLADSETEGQAESVAAAHWLFASRLCQELHDPERSLQCVQKAYHRHPNDYQVRYALGRSLLDLEEFADAETHFRWCSLRKPKDTQLQAVIKTAVRGRVARRSPTTSSVR